MLIIADPERINRQTRLVRILTRLLLGLLAVSAVLTTGLLVHVLVVGGELTHSATRLLLTGNAVWISNNNVFAPLYWEVDGDGSVARALDPPKYPDLAFPQQMNPRLTPAGKGSTAACSPFAARRSPSGPAGSAAGVRSSPRRRCERLARSPWIGCW
jgi:hypothetical protein